MTQPRARALHKSGQNGKSGSGDTIGIRVPSEDALRKIAFNVVSVSGERSKKSAQREWDRKYENTSEKRRRDRAKESGATEHDDEKRGEKERKGKRKRKRERERGAQRTSVLF